MKRFTFVFVVFLSLSFFSWGQTPFTAGNIVISRVGDGTTPLSFNAAPVYLDEYTPSGTLVQSILMPTSASGSNQILTSSGTQANEALLNLSVNGKYLVLAGSNATPGTSTITASTIGLVDFNGAVNTSTSLTDYASTPKAAVSDDGTRVWFGGSGAVRYASTGSNTSTLLSSLNVRNINISNGQLYVGTSSTSSFLSTVGTGLPTTAGQTTALISGFPTSSFTMYQFAFADLDPNVPGNDVLYFASQSSGAAGGISKYSLVNGVWVSNGAVGATTDGYEGLTVKVDGQNVTIFATRRGGNTSAGGEVVKLVDASGYNGTLTGTPATLITVPVIDNMAFRSIANAPAAPPSCAQPSIRILGISPTAANISWTGIADAAGYQYAITTNSTAPSSGIDTTSNNFGATGLINGTTYYVYVRTNCGNFNYSEWSSVSFVAGCQAPAAPSVNVTNITNAGTANVGWTDVFGAASYEYAVDANPTPPATGTELTGTTFQATGLVSVTKYYVHVRSNCGSGNFSPWTTVPLTTDCFMPSTSVKVNANNTGASWNAVANAIRYEYAVTYDQADPLSGTSTTDTTYTMTDLRQANGYYLHVRSICSTGAVSDWATVQFHTPGLDAYPNPVRQTLTVNIYGLSSTAGNLLIYDESGKMVKKVSINTGTVNVDMQGLAAGVYIIKFIANSGEHQMVRIVKL